MKAVVYTQYGGPDVLHLKEVEKPTPKDDEVLIKVHTTTVTTGDCNMRGFVFVPPGFKFFSRLAFGLNKPRKQILGVEVAGVIEFVGKDVKTLKVGDAVCGVDGKRVGAYAEYKTMPEDAGLILKPENMTFEEAAAFPNGALTAYTFLKKLVNIQSGQKVLVNGASGSIGTAAVQIAKYYGAHVTGVCSGRNIDLVKSLGVDEVIDYTQEDFTKRDETYDIIFDTVGKTSFAACKNSLTPDGRFLAAAGGLKEFRQMFWTSIRGGKRVIAGVSSESKDDLQVLKGIVESGKLKPVIDCCYPLEDIAEAHRYVDTGRKRGNVVITVRA